MLNLLTLTVVIVIVTTTATDTQWAIYKSRHGKMYQENEDRIRHAIYEENLRTIQNHNALFEKGLASFYLGESRFTDMTEVEFSKTMLGPALKEDVDNRSNQQKFLIELENVTVPSEVNWVKKGYVTGVKDLLAECVSSYAFSTTGAIEGAHFKKTGNLVSLSEKNVMDCSWNYGNYGCFGGEVTHGFQYVIANKGIDTEVSYPYLSKNGPCRFNASNIGATISSFVKIPKGSVLSLLQAVASLGPVSAWVDASHLTFNSYRGGIYDEPRCNSTDPRLAVLVVGYGSDGGQDYWLIKNSWSTDWGEKGYMRMIRNKNNVCGIATFASYPIA